MRFLVNYKNSQPTSPTGIIWLRSSLASTKGPWDAPLSFKGKYHLNANQLTPEQFPEEIGNISFLSQDSQAWSFQHPPFFSPTVLSPAIFRDKWIFAISFLKQNQLRWLKHSSLPDPTSLFHSHNKLALWTDASFSDEELY